MLILLQFVSTISIVRSSPGIDLSTFFSSFLNLKNNVILMVLEEFGCSIYSVILPMEQVPSIVGYGMGNSYIKSIPLFLVNLPGIDIQKYMADSCYINHLQGTLSMGGHIIGELYYNFGSFFSLFFALIIGIIIGRLSYIFELLFKTKVNVTSLFYIMVMHSLIVWIRDYFSCLIRPIIWGAIIIVIINLFINNSRVKKRVIIYAS